MPKFEKLCVVKKRVISESMAGPRRNAPNRRNSNKNYNFWPKFLMPVWIKIGEILPQEITFANFAILLIPQKTFE
jgi:hypothetical protein